MIQTFLRFDKEVSRAASDKGVKIEVKNFRENLQRQISE